MNAFQQLRSWLRTSPSSERLLTGMAGVLVLALAAWVATPTTRPAEPGLDVLAGAPAEGGTSGTAGGGASGGTSGLGGSSTGSTGQALGPGAATIVGGSTGTGGTSGATATTGAGGATSAGTGTTPGIGSTGGVASPSCLSAPAGQGVTGKEITVGVVLVSIGALNSTLGIPTEDEHKRAYEAVFDDYNKRGGVQCRKLVPKFYSGNPLDASTERAACLQIQEDGVFAVINNMFNADVVTCIPQAKIPNFWYTSPHVPQIKKYAPYILSFQSDYDRLVTTYVRGAKTVGWFNGAGKIGILDQTCYPDLSSKIRSELTASGFPSSRWSVYNYGCSTAGTGQEPDKDTAAAAQFSREGVTHVMSVAYGKTTQFAKAAEQQRYTPKYAIMSDAQIQAADRSSAGQSPTLDGALDVTSDQIGGENTPGTKFSPATTRCSKLITGAGLKDPVDPLAGTAGTLYGVACASTAMLVAALTHAPALQRNALATGLARAGSLDLSFPAGPAVFNNAANPTGGQFWRTAAFESDCNCWMVTRPTFRKDFS